MSRIKKSDRLKMELVLLVMMIAAGYFICRESGVRGINYFTGLLIVSAFALLAAVSKASLQLQSLSGMHYQVKNGNPSIFTMSLPVMV